MATTNANDSRPRDNRGREARSNENYKPRINRENGKNSSTSGQGSREYKPYSKDMKSFGTRRDDREGTRKPTRTSSSRDYKSGGYVYNKDKDLDDVKHGKGYGRDQRMGDSRSKAVLKEKEQQPDKFETMKRLEKEKKAMQKKNEELNKKGEKPSKVMIKQRRTNNIDWTKGYANGLYGDDDEDYTEYM